MQTTGSEEKDPLACDSNVVGSGLNTVSDSPSVTASAEFKEEPSSSSSMVVSQAPVGGLETNPESQNNVAPIKLVDMSKLLKKKSPFEHEAKNSVSSSNSQVDENKALNTQLSPGDPSFLKSKCEGTVQDSNSHFSEAFQKTTISKILECLRVILPMTFDLKKLIPNDKISLLVLRYLKVENNKEFDDRVQLNLKIIVDTAKIKVTEFGDDLNHPYHNITEKSLEQALKKCMPQSFSMSDVSNDLLNCLCFIMGQDIFSDGYHILRRKIRKYTREGLMFNEIITQTSESNSLPNTKTEQSKQTAHKRKHSVVETGLINEEKTFHGHDVSKKKHVKSKKCVKNELLSDKSGSKENSLNEKFNTVLGNTQSTNNKATDRTLVDGSTGNSSLKPPPIIEEPKNNHKSDSKKIMEEESASHPHPIENLESILTYLKNQHCTAKDALTSFRLMFYLCKFLQVKCNQPNLQKVKSALRYIAEKKINLNGIKDKQKFVSRKVLFEHPPESKEKTTDKLKMRPIVILRNLADYKKDQFTFMNSQKLNHKTEYYSRIVPSLGHSPKVNLQRYANDYIQKITNEDYKTFRKIVVKKYNSNLVARIKYKRITPGCLVFVKDYRTASLGWVKGKVLSSVGQFTYTVQIDNGEILQCVLDQIRPVPDVESVPAGLRTPRAVKPKQMFDL